MPEDTHVVFARKYENKMQVVVSFTTFRTPTITGTQLDPEAALTNQRAEEAVVRETALRRVAEKRLIVYEVGNKISPFSVRAPVG